MDSFDWFKIIKHNYVIAMNDLLNKHHIVIPAQRSGHYIEVAAQRSGPEILIQRSAT